MNILFNKPFMADNEAENIHLTIAFGNISGNNLNIVPSEIEKLATPPRFLTALWLNTTNRRPQ